MVFSESAAKKGVNPMRKMADGLPSAALRSRAPPPSPDEPRRQCEINQDKGEIEVRVDWEAGQNGTQGTLLEIEVQDTGLGIPQDKLEAIFKPFFVQAGADLEQERPGTGLGLAIVQRLTKRMQEVPSPPRPSWARDPPSA